MSTDRIYDRNGTDITDECKCPKCGEEMHREEADVGIGIMYGPWACPQWYYSPNQAEIERIQKEFGPEWYVDPWGMATRKSVLAERLAHLGLKNTDDLVNDVFGPSSGETNEALPPSPSEPL